MKKYQITKQTSNTGEVFYKVYIEETKKSFWSKKTYKVMESLDYCEWDSGGGQVSDRRFSSVEEAKKALIIEMGSLSKHEEVIESGSCGDLKRNI